MFQIFAIIQRHWHFIQRIVEAFHIELIVDLGDLADYGTSLEMELFAQQPSPVLKNSLCFHSGES